MMDDTMINFEFWCLHLLSSSLLPIFLPHISIYLIYDRYKGKLKCNQFYSTISKAIPIQGSTPQMTSMVLHSRYAYYNTTLIKVTTTDMLFPGITSHCIIQYFYANIHYNA